MSPIEPLYYHGYTTQSPYSNHTFWVYPPTLKLQNKWNTYIEANVYCNNHQVDGISKNNPLCRQYTCRGHLSLDHFKEAQQEWQRMGWSMNVTTEEEPSDLDNRIGHMIDRIETLENRIVSLQNEHDNENKIIEARKPMLGEVDMFVFIILPLLLLSLLLFMSSNFQGLSNKGLDL
jgi:hypothetical protein